jgi:hypothetical protein
MRRTQDWYDHHAPRKAAAGGRDGRKPAARRRVRA